MLTNVSYVRKVRLVKSKIDEKEWILMFKKIDKNANRIARHKRVRRKVTGTPERPRLSVFRSSKNIYSSDNRWCKQSNTCSHFTSSLEDAIKGDVSYRK